MTAALASTPSTAATVHAMRQYGSSFTKALAQTWLCADEVNKARIAAAFPDLFARYRDMATGTTPAPVVPVPALTQNEIALLAALMHAHGALVAILEMERDGVSSTAIYAAVQGAAACAKAAIEKAGRKA